MVGDVTRAPNRSLGEAALFADAVRPGGWLLTVDRVRQSYVDLEDPTFLDFGYVQDFARVFDALPEGRLAVTHIGGGGCTFARYIAVTRPGSPQIVLEPDAELTALVRARLPLPAGHRIRIRPVEGRAGVAELRDASADVVVLDAFHGGRIPGQLTTGEFFADIARVLRPEGVLIANIADGPPLTYSTRVVAAVRTALPEVLVITESGVMKSRRFGNLVVAASRADLPHGAIRRACASAAFPRSVSVAYGHTAQPLTDATSMRSPEPPEATWRVSDEDEDDD
jgi:hypothetical protein